MYYSSYSNSNRIWRLTCAQTLFSQLRKQVPDPSKPPTTIYNVLSVDNASVDGNTKYINTVQYVLCMCFVWFAYQLLVNSFGMHVHVKRSNIPRSILLIHVVYIQCIHTYKNDTSVLSNVYLLFKIKYTIGFFVFKKKSLMYHKAFLQIYFASRSNFSSNQHHQHYHG